MLSMSPLTDLDLVSPVIPWQEPQCQEAFRRLPELRQAPLPVACLPPGGTDPQNCPEHVPWWRVFGG